MAASGMTSRQGGARGERHSETLWRLQKDKTTYWDIRDIQHECRIGRTTAWRLVKEPGFPAPVVVGERSLSWPAYEVVQYLETMRQRDRYIDRRSRPMRGGPSDDYHYRIRELRERLRRSER